MPSPQRLRKSSGSVSKSLGSMSSWQTKRSPYETPGILMKNSSGGALVDGDVVIVDNAEDRAVKTTTTAGMPNPLVVLTGADAGENVRCYPLSGVAVITCDGPAISPGDKIITSSTEKYGKKLEAEAASSLLGIAVSGKAGAGDAEIDVLLLCSPV